MISNYSINGQKRAPRVGVFGLGYVGLPLAFHLSEVFEVVGYDLNKERVNELKQGQDNNNEIDSRSLRKALEKDLFCTTNLSDMEDIDIYIVTVPTPVNQSSQPDLGPLISASSSIGTVISKGNMVIYESTVFPGATEEACIPEVEKRSGLTANKDFLFGYSPERINPGDKENTLPNILKVVSGSNEEALSIVSLLYEKIIHAGIHKAPSVKVAEAAKVIENTQRDMNIALINEFSIIFDKLDISTKDVLDAASTKWNFISLLPGLVGGHCIGVDPYYLIHKAKEVGYVPDLITTGRQINANMPAYVSQRVINGAIKKGIDIANANCLILGYSFKENCPDVRNSGTIPLVRELSKYVKKLDIHDPLVLPKDRPEEHVMNFTDDPLNNSYEIIIICSAHKIFDDLYKILFNNSNNNECFIFSLKSIPDHKTDQTL
tara:strand:+ start:309 stop:1610 length:1302 start_codon:yes stop_codon:yes gene_type:complete